MTSRASTFYELEQIASQFKSICCVGLSTESICVWRCNGIRLINYLNACNKHYGMTTPNLYLVYSSIDPVRPMIALHNKLRVIPYWNGAFLM